MSITCQHINSQWLNRSATQVAPELIGCTLVRRMHDERIYRGLIVEVEAYEPDDPAMHAYRRKSARNWVVFGPPGFAYILKIHGHPCINVVTDADGTPSAVLIRALQLESIPPWIDGQREFKPYRIAAGPGKLCRVLKIDLTLNATFLQPGEALWLEHRHPHLQEQLREQKVKITQTTRIGLTKGTDLALRWYLSDCLAVWGLFSNRAFLSAKVYSLLNTLNPPGS